MSTTPLPSPNRVSDTHRWMPAPSPHASSPTAVAVALGVDPRIGLSSGSIDARREVAGRNELQASRPPSWLARFAGQFRSLLILVLVAAAGLSLVVGELKDAIVVGVVLLLNAVLGTVQEARADRSVRTLQGLLPSRAKVRRDGGTGAVAASELVPGDVVLVEAGDRVPADGRLLVDAMLAVDESSLTGESAPGVQARRVEGRCGDPGGRPGRHGVDEHHGGTWPW